jgi:hypothetical protein
VLERDRLGADGPGLVLGEPAPGGRSGPWSAQLLTGEQRFVAPVPRPAGADENHLTGPDFDRGVLPRTFEVVDGDFVPGLEAGDAVDRGDVEQDGASHVRLELVDTEVRESLVALQGVCRLATVHVPVLGDMGESVDMRADVAAKDDELVGRRATVAADNVSVPALERQPERRMVRRLWHADPVRVREVHDLRLPKHPPYGLWGHTIPFTRSASTWAGVRLSWYRGSASTFTEVAVPSRETRFHRRRYRTTAGGGSATSTVRQGRRGKGSPAVRG